MLPGPPTVPAPPRRYQRLDSAGLVLVLGAVAEAGGELDALNRMIEGWSLWLQVPLVDDVQQGWTNDLLQRFREQIAKRGGEVQDLGVRGAGSMAYCVLSVTGLGEHAWQVHIWAPWVNMPRAA